MNSSEIIFVCYCTAELTLYELKVEISEKVKFLRQNCTVLTCFEAVYSLKL